MQILKNSAIIAIFGIISQLMGLVRDRLFASHIGIGGTLDIYYMSFRVADFIYAIILAFVGAVTVLPIISKYVAEKNEAEVSRRFNSIFFFFSISITALASIAFFAAPYFVKIYTSHLDLTSVETVILMSRILLLQPIILGISNIISVLSQAHKHFFIFSLAPLFYNMGIILGVLFFYDKYGVYGLAYGVVLGAIAHFLVQSITIWKAKFKFRFVMDMSVIKEELSLAGPRSVSLLLQQSRIIVMNIFAGYFGVGVLSVFVFATTLAALPLQFFGVSFAVASFPKMSEMFELRDEDGFRGLAKKSIFNLTWISIIVSFLCALFASLIARIIYGDVAHIESVVVMFAVLCVAIPFQTVNWFSTRVFYARRDSWSPLVAQITAFTVTLGVLYACYVNGIGAMSLVYATVIGCIAESIAMFSLYIKKSRKML